MSSLEQDLPTKGEEEAELTVAYTGEVMHIRGHPVLAPATPT
jgi:hypothetical protein